MLNKTMSQQWMLPLTLTLLACALFALQPSLLDGWQFDRSAIEQGEYWRLFTGNLFHTNSWHLFFNLLGLLMLTQLFGRDISPLHFGLFSIANASLVGTLLYLYSPTIELYVGLSGYLHGLFVLGCLVEIRAGRRSSYLLLGGIAAKIGWETFYGASQQMTVLINAQVATDAHLFGALGALPLFALYCLVKRFHHGDETQ